MNLKKGDIVTAHGYCQKCNKTHSYEGRVNFIGTMTIGLDGVLGLSKHQYRKSFVKPAVPEDNEDALSLLYREEEPI